MINLYRIKTGDKKTRNFMKATIRSVMGACALVLGMAGLAPSESHGAPCTVFLAATNPDGSLTNATACALATPANSGETATTTALNAANPGGINTWTLIDRDESPLVPNSDNGFSYAGTTSGTWTITDASFTRYIVTMKDGSPLQRDFLWFLIDMSVALNGTWQMYGVDGIAREISHMDLFGAVRQVPEPGILFLLGSALLGLGVARRWTSRT